MTFNRPGLTAARDAALELFAARLDDSAFDVLPHVPAAWLDDAFARHVPADFDLALRHKIVAVSWMPTLVLHAVVSRAGLAEAQRRGLAVVARISPAAYRQAIRRHHGRHLLRHAVRHLARTRPEMSASQRLSAGQKPLFLGLAALSGFLAWLVGPAQAFTAISVTAMLFFTLVVAIRIFCLLPSPAAPRLDPPDLQEPSLPVYSVLVPLFKERAVLGQLIEALLAIDYPRDRLDIKIILEEKDGAMQRAVADMALPAHMDVIVVPSGRPQTKPKALNYALQFARGELVTIFDAEDIPDPLQLRRAAAAFAAAAPEVACLQAVLAFYNSRDNWLARQFSAEYAALFEVMLPALAERGFPFFSAERPIISGGARSRRSAPGIPSM